MQRDSYRVRVFHIDPNGQSIESVLDIYNMIIKEKMCCFVCIDKTIMIPMEKIEMIETKAWNAEGDFR